MKRLYFDTETTGLNPAKHGIHQISGYVWIDGKTVQEFNFKVRPNPKAEIDDKALVIAGVTREQVLLYPPMEQVYKEIISMLSKYVDKFEKKDKFTLVGYNNASFDNDFLRGFFRQNNDEYFGSWFWSSSIDVMVIAMNHLEKVRHEMTDFKLKTVAKQFGIPVDESKLHDAMYDIELTKNIHDIISTSHIPTLFRI